MPCNPSCQSPAIHTMLLRTGTLVASAPTQVQTTLHIHLCSTLDLLYKLWAGAFLLDGLSFLGPTCVTFRTRIGSYYALGQPTVHGCYEFHCYGFL